MGPELGAWDGLVVVRPVDGGERNDVFVGLLGAQRVAVRRSRRSAESFAWELDLLQLLDRRGFRVPVPIPTASGALSHGGVVVQRWIEGGQPVTEADWTIVAAELQRLHSDCRDVGQRPGCSVVTELTGSSTSGDADLAAMPADVAAMVLEVFASVADVSASLVHGDPAPANVCIGDDGRVGLIDWDESRVDVVWHDLSDLGVQVLPDAEHARAMRLSDAWEVANAWTVEPEYARRRLARLTDPLARMGPEQDLDAREPDPIFSDRRLAATYDVFEGDRDDLEAYEQLADELGARSVLDVGCGTGELACRLARRGFGVTGLDPAAASVEIAAAKPGAAGVTWIIGETSALPPMQVDMATMTGNVAQVFVTDEEWLATLRGIRAALRPGGHLVFETRDPAVRAWEDWTSERTRQRAALRNGDTVETWCEVVGVEAGLVSFRWTNVFESDGARLTSGSTLRFRTSDEIEGSLGDTGYEVIDVRNAPDRPGSEMVFIARRR